MKHITSLLLAAAVTLGAVGTAAADDAAAAKKPAKQAKFKASLKGEQNITWSYNRIAEPPCYGGEDAGGSVRMSYATEKPGKVTAYEIRKDNPLWETFYRRVIFSPGLQAFATATMEGTHSAGQPPQPEQCEDNGGGVTPTQPECGTGTALIDLSLYSVNKNRIVVLGNATSWDPGFSELRNLFGSCPYWQGGPYTRATAEGDLEPADVKLKETKLFDKHGERKFVLHGSTVDCWDEEGLAICNDEVGPFKGKTVTTWTLTLKRVK